LDDQLKAPIIPLFDRNHFCRKRGHSGNISYSLPGVSKGLLFRSQNCVFCRLRDPEFHNGLCGDLDLLLRLWIDANSCFSLLLHELTKAGQNKLTVLLYAPVCEAERVSRKTPAVLLSVLVAVASAVWSSVLVMTRALLCQPIPPISSNHVLKTWRNSTFSLPMLRKIISGCQTGAARAGLDFAVEVGLAHGGYVPKGGKLRMAGSTKDIVSSN
jgi:Circularly permutated YpsA SLOG family